MLIDAQLVHLDLHTQSLSNPHKHTPHYPGTTGVIRIIHGKSLGHLIARN